MYILSYALLFPKVRKKNEKTAEPAVFIFILQRWFKFPPWHPSEELLPQKLHGQDNLSCNI